MPLHIRDGHGLALCTSKQPDHGDTQCVLCYHFSSLHPDHITEITDNQRGFVASCACGWECKTQATPSHASRQAFDHRLQFVVARLDDTDGPSARKKARKVSPTALCRCGCTEPARSTFRPGHDARWLAQLRRQVQLGELDRNDALTQVGAISPQLQLKLQKALDGRPVA